ncbi:MAG: cytochrome c biogenesis protein CcsA, partial [Alistipes sp.]|nr:cytochrome c biogenesis protein CcsA [Alistipes sp.]
YSLLAFLMLNGIAGLWLARRRPAESARLRTAGLLMLYPALFSLAAGIFVGAVWANVSWGRYWGWDPKETWALITMMVYALPLHGESIAAFRRPAVFHGWCAAAFVSVAVTYFGVNFILGGMHGYAA